MDTISLVQSIRQDVASLEDRFENENADRQVIAEDAIAALSRVADELERS